MARTRKKKVKEPEKLWEIPTERLQKEIDRLESFLPTSGYLKVLKAEVARTDRSQPMNMDEFYD